MIKLSDGRVMFSHFEESNANVSIDLVGDKNAVVTIKKSDGTLLASIVIHPTGSNTTVAGVWEKTS